MYRSRRVLVLIGLGFASGLPNPLVDWTLSAWMASAGVRVETIGLFALVGLPYSLKVLWAPLVDRYRLPWLGRRRDWMLATQLACAAGIAAMAVLDPVAAPLAVAALAAGVALVSATQDIALDAYRVDVLRPEERPHGTATYVTGYRIGLLVAASVTAYLADLIPWRSVYLFAAAALAVGPLSVLIAPDPPPAGARPTRLADAFTRPLVDFFSRPGAGTAFAFVALYKIGELMVLKMSSAFAYQLRGDLGDVGLWGSVSLAGTVAGVIAGGPLVARLEVRRALLLFGAIQAASNLGYLALAAFGANTTVLVGAVALDNVCGGIATAAFVAYLMSLCNPAYSATQYALLSSASSLVGRLVSAGSGYLVAHAGWPAFFTISTLAAIPALVVLTFARVDRWATH